MSKPTIVTDLDGVVVDLAMELCLCLEADFDVVLRPEDMQTYMTHDALFPHLQDIFRNPLALSRYFKHRVYTNSAVLLRARPYLDVLQAYRAFMAAGGQLRTCTSRATRPGCVEATNAWCYKYELPPPRFTREFGRHEEGKLGYVKQVVRDGVGVIWFVDDRPETARSVAGYLADGASAVYMPERPWTEHEYGGGVKRRDLFGDIFDWVDKQ